MDNSLNVQNDWTPRLCGQRSSFWLFIRNALRCATSAGHGTVYVTILNPLTMKPRYHCFICLSEKLVLLIRNATSSFGSFGALFPMLRRPSRAWHVLVGTRKAISEAENDIEFEWQKNNLPVSTVHTCCACACNTSSCSSLHVHADPDYTIVSSSFESWAFVNNVIY